MPVPLGTISFGKRGRQEFHQLEENLIMKTVFAKSVDANKLRSSAVIAGELAELERSKSEAQARLADLDAKYDAAILAGDNAAERHEAETAATKRAIRRAELRTLELQPELKAAQELEAETNLRRRQSEARGAVAAVIAEIERSYREPAKVIAMFLQRYNAAERLAADAGVEGPHRLLRVEPDTIVPASEEKYDVYINEHGQETDRPYPAGVYLLDPKTDGRIRSG